MDRPIILVDFAGTLIRTEIIEEAQGLRNEILRRAAPTAQEHANPEELYADNRLLVQELTGLSTDMEILYRENDGETIRLRGEQYNNQIATNLFQIGMYRAAKRHGRAIFAEGLLDELARVQENYALGIVSGVRTDIISGMLAISDCPVRFDHIYGQPPILGISNTENMDSLSEHGDIRYVIGDKRSDLEPAKAYGAVAIWARWGHASGGEEEVADHTISRPEELADIIR